MTDQQKAALRSLILSTPSAKALAVSGNDSGVAALLNTPTITVNRKVAADKILRWAAETGAVKKLKTEQAIGTNGKQAASEAALLVLDRGNDLTLDAEVMALLTLLVTGGVLSISDRDKLLARGAEQIGVGEQAIGRPVTSDDVSESLAGDRPEGKIGALPSE